MKRAVVVLGILLLGLLLFWPRKDANLEPANEMAGCMAKTGYTVEVAEAGNLNIRHDANDTQRIDRLLDACEQTVRGGG